MKRYRQRDYLYRAPPYVKLSDETRAFVAVVFSLYHAVQVELPLPETRSPAAHRAVKQLFEARLVLPPFRGPDFVITRASNVGRMRYLLVQPVATTLTDRRRWFRYAPFATTSSITPRGRVTVRVPDPFPSPLTPAEERLLTVLAPLGPIEPSALPLLAQGAAPTAQTLLTDEILESLPDGRIDVPKRLAQRYGSLDSLPTVRPTINVSVFQPRAEAI